jgi:rhodanese-related sulfurtransferase
MDESRGVRKKGPMSISKEAVVEKMRKTQVVVLNVLSEGEFQKLHIQGSYNLPLTPDHGAFAREVERQYGKKNLFILYGSNITSYAAIEAAEALQKRGFEAEAYLSGMKEWIGAGLPAEGTYASKKAIFQ